MEKRQPAEKDIGKFAMHHYRVRDTKLMISEKHQQINLSDLRFVDELKTEILANKTPTLFMVVQKSIYDNQRMIESINQTILFLKDELKKEEKQY